MKNERINYLTVGIFVIFMFACLIGVLFYITGNAGLRETYYSTYDNISGVKVGTIVTYEGYRFGQVQEIEPLPSIDGIQYKVIFSAKDGWKIPSDSSARIHVSGLLSAVVIDIHEGASKDYIKPGGEIRGQAGGNIMTVMNRLASDVSQLTNEGLKPLMESLQKSVGEGLPAIMEKLDKLLAQLNGSAEVLARIMSPENQTKITNIIDNAENTSVNFAQLSTDIKQTANNINLVTNDISKLINDTKPELKVSVAELRSTLETISENVDSIIHNMNSTSRNMNEFSRQIRNNPSLLIGGSKSDDSEATKNE